MRAAIQASVEDRGPWAHWPQIETMALGLALRRLADEREWNQHHWLMSLRWLQAAVAAKHHVIVAHEVVTEGSDRDELATMAVQAREATGIEELTVAADRGYFKGEQNLQCEQIGITPVVPKTLTYKNLVDGRFDKQDFIYIVANDEFRCPVNARAIKRFTTLEGDRAIDVYWSSACPQRSTKDCCTASNYSRINRWQHEHILDSMQERLDRRPEMMRCGARRSNIRSIRSNIGWARPTS